MKMDSPPSSSTWSEAAFMLSDDSGLLLTSGSVSSGSVSGESRSGRYKLNMELLESDGEDKSLSQADSLDGMSDGMCGENFNTLKKGPTSNWCEMLLSPKIMASIDPPPEFQDDPLPNRKMHCALPTWLDKLANHLMKSVLEDALAICCKITWSIHCSQDCHAVVPELRPRYHNMIVPRLCWTPELFPYSPCHANRPNSRNSLTPSRLSSSHNSLNLTSSHRVDDSNFITQAVSHDALLSGGGQISDIYNVPFDSDIYAMPVDMIRPRTPPRRRDKQFKYQRKRRRNVSAGSQFELAWHVAQATQLAGKPRAVSHVIKSQALLSDVCGNGKRHSVPGTAVPQPETEPIHMTLQEVRQYLQTLYSSSSDSSDNKNHKSIDNSLKFENNVSTITNIEQINYTPTSKYAAHNSSNVRRKNNKKNTFVINVKNRKVKDTTSTTMTIAATIATTTTTSTTVKTSTTEAKQNNNNNNNINNNNCTNNENKLEKRKKSPARAFSSNLKHTICNFFRFRKISSSPEHIKREIVVVDEDDENSCDKKPVLIPVQKRALPPLPSGDANSNLNDGINECGEGELSMDFATSIEKVKNYGWYWGPISAEAAEKILSNEPEGSFIVRDSSDDHYIFSLSFKLNGCVRHVRIENYQGNFSFGSCTKFKSHTIVEFIENAVEHSRSGRYLFFLHRRPVLGPMRVQLLHPVSRFKQVQSLQHMCRFVILKLVRRDLVGDLPLPRRIIDYLRMKHYYSELLSDWEDSEGSGSDYKKSTTTITSTTTTTTDTTTTTAATTTTTTTTPQQTS